jgi:hypothetical protein
MAHRQASKNKGTDMRNRTLPMAFGAGLVLAGSTTA